MRNFFIINALCFCISCGPIQDNDSFDSLSSLEQAKYQKYLILGQKLYSQNCENCHKKEGDGLKQLIPALSGSDYLKENQSKIACLIKNGSTEPIMVNGKKYQPTMPDNNRLTALEIAEVITYINNSWGNKYGFVDVKTVQSTLKNCQ